MDTQWGPCKSCQWWQIEPEAQVDTNTLGFCIEKSLQSYRLRVSGESGCNRFLKGDPARAKESAAKPPTAQPTR